MAILKIKQLIADIENDTRVVLDAPIGKATSAGNSGTTDIAGTASKATSAGQAGTSVIAGTASFATSAGRAGTASTTSTAA